MVINNHIDKMPVNIVYDKKPIKKSNKNSNEERVVSVDIELPEQINNIGKEKIIYSIHF